MVTGDNIEFFVKEIIGFAMIKYLVLIITSLWLAACAAHDERYYSLHPNALQKAISQCSKNQPTDISCDQLKTVAARVNELAYELRSSPQGYGKKILSLQEDISKQESSLKGAPNASELQSSIDENQKNLAERLAIVKWLESPES